MIRGQGEVNETTATSSTAPLGRSCLLTQGIDAEEDRGSHKVHNWTPIQDDSRLNMFPKHVRGSQSSGIGWCGLTDDSLVYPHLSVTSATGFSLGLAPMRNAAGPVVVWRSSWCGVICERRGRLGMRSFTLGTSQSPAVKTRVLALQDDGLDGTMGVPSLDR